VSEAAAITVAATVATAPLMAAHFGTASLVALPANLVAVAAEAPVMWLGMLASAVGQAAILPVEPITWLAGLFAAYIAQVAAWFAGPGWAQIELASPGPGALLAVYVALGLAALTMLRALARRRGLGSPAGRVAIALTAAAASVGGAIALGGPLGAAPVPEGAGLRVRVLDVGQGDAILVEPMAGGPILVDAGPPGGAAAARLEELGVRSLAALVITHPDLDHAGGAAEVLAATRVSALVVARADRALLGAAAAAGTPVRRATAGATIRDGPLRMDVLWPPQRAPAGEPNAASLVLLARWRRFRMLLAGDAEAELAPVHPGDVDVLKVAHHGSEDAGLEALLTETEPELALISVGADNPFGHPAPPTLAALARARVPVLRTDTDGELVVSATPDSWTVTDRGDG
jgi:competence protein ComEC